jgi:PhnB protein
MLPMQNSAKPIPDGFHAVTPYLFLRDAPRAIEFYVRAFGARERFRMPGPDGKIMHAEIQIGDSRIMLGEEMPERGSRSPLTLKGTAVDLFLYVPDVDATFAQAVAAGAKELSPVQDMFWGDRWGSVLDPFRHECNWPLTRKTSHRKK